VVTLVRFAYATSIFGEPLSPLMEEADSLKERNRAVTGVPVAIRPVRLSIYDFLRSNEQGIVETLTKRSGLNVDRDDSLGKPYGLKFYAYFHDVDSANNAALVAVRITYCRTRVRKGTFDVTHLVRDNSTATP